MIMASKDSIMNNEHYLQLFESLSHDSSHALERKKTALNHFLSEGFPSKKQEAWRYLDISKIINVPYRLTKKTVNKKINLPIKMECNPLIFINGYFYPELSNPYPEDINLFSIRTKNLKASTLEQKEKNAFQHLNEAFLQESLLITIKKNSHLNRPLYFLNLFSNEEQFLMSHIHVEIILEESASAVFIEHDFSELSNEHLHTHQTDITLNNHSLLTHYHLHELTKNNYVFNHLLATQKKESRIEHFTFVIKNQLFRQFLNFNQTEDQTTTSSYGLMRTMDNAQADIQLNINHQRNHGSSTSQFHTTPNQTSRINFNGIIEVNKGTLKNKASLLNKNIPLSSHAEINTKPVFKIYSEDVACSHGATISKFDPEVINFLNSRGIETTLAKEMIVNGFSHEIIDKVKNKKIKEYLLEKML